MTLEEACKKFDVPRDVILGYIDSGYIRKNDNQSGNDYQDEDLERMGIIALLLEAGCDPEQIRQYLRLNEKESMRNRQVTILRKKRRELLDEIHKKQRVLDNLDAIIRDMNKY